MRYRIRKRGQYWQLYLLNSEFPGSTKWLMPAERWQTLMWVATGDPAYAFEGIAYISEGRRDLPELPDGSGFAEWERDD